MPADGEVPSRQLFAEVYGELRRLARSRLRHGGRPQGLETTELVHESFLRLCARQRLHSEDRAVFFSYVGRVMRSVVVDHVREMRASKRGGGAEHVSLTTGVDGVVLDDERLLALDSALQSLERLAPQLAELVDLRYFAGLGMAEVAQLRGMALRSVERDWTKARAMLAQLLAEG